MTTLPHQSDRRAKIVVALLDGRRLKGYSLNVSPLKDFFDLLPQEGTPLGRGTRVELKDVKAVFFVKDFVGTPGDVPTSLGNRSLGRVLEITFADGEKLVGVSLGYSSQKPSFFVIPTDPDSNNSRILVITRNTAQVKPLLTEPGVGALASTRQT